MPSLIERRMAGREQWIEGDGFELRIRRPTRFQMAVWKARSDANDALATPDPAYGMLQNLEVLRECVIDWRKVTELTLQVPGGDGAVLPFDAALLLDYMAEQITLMVATINAIYAAVQSDEERKAAATKN